MRIGSGIFLLVGACLLMASSTASAVNQWPDTGQADCYDDLGGPVSCSSADFPGQDASHVEVARDLADNGDFTVSDNVTGLMWMQNGDTAQFDLAGAGTYIAGLNSGFFAGYDDWRLPTAQELSTLVDAGFTYQPLEGGNDNSYGPFSLANEFNPDYWTSTPALSSPVEGGYTCGSDDRMLVRFRSGLVANSCKTPPANKLYHVLAVRAEVAQVAPSFQMDTPVAGIVWDENTGLMWQQAHGSTVGAVNASFRWGGGTEATGACDGTADPDGKSGLEEDALCYCDSLTLGGYTDWRLSDRNELHSIFDYTNTPAALASVFVDGTTLGKQVFWAATSLDSTPSKAWATGPIESGTLLTGQKGADTNHVRCVRGRVFKVDVSAGANLQVSDAALGTNWVDYGADQAVTFTADPGFSITEVTIDGTPQGPQPSPYTHTFTGVVGSHVINATTALNTYDIAVTVGDGGLVTDVNNAIDIVPPGGTVTVDGNATATFEVTPSAHYSIDVVQFDGVDVVLNGSNQYTTPAIVADGHTFSATFVEDAQFELAVTTTGSGQGTVTSDDNRIDCPGACSSMYYFDDPGPIVLTATPNAGSTFAGWTGDCDSTTGTTCTLDDMSRARNVTATFDSPKEGMNILLMIQGVISAIAGN